MKQISILGCGWLGLPLAKSLIANGFSINGSTTSIEKISILEKSGINPFMISLSAELVMEETITSIEKFLTNSQLLVIDIPPKLRGDSNDNFVGKIKNLIPFIIKAGVTKVVFVSSTSVYADTKLIAQSVTELDIPEPNSESGKQLLETECLLQNHSNFQTTVIRFGGLIGEDRHPITFLAGKTNIENPEAPINLIHQNDCIGIMENIIDKILSQDQFENGFFNATFNCVCPLHPSRKEYYTRKALELDLPLPEFDKNNTSIGKLVSSNKVETLLKYTFKNKL